MVNPFDYLYYKIYKAMYFINGGDETVKRYTVMGAFLLINILSFYIAMVGDMPPTIFSIVTALLILLILIIFYMTKREKKILDKYEKESKKARIRGNIFVLLYVVISIVAFALALKSIMPAK